MPERSFRLARCDAQRVLEFGRLLNEPDAFAAAPGCRLDHHGEADLLGDPCCFLGFDFAFGAGYDRDTGLQHEATRGDLVAEQAHSLAGGADEFLPGLLHGIGKVGVLPKEPVARMDSVCLRFLEGLHDLGDVQVALQRRPRSQ